MSSRSSMHALADDDLVELGHQLAHHAALFFDHGGGGHADTGAGAGRESLGYGCHGETI